MDSPISLKAHAQTWSNYKHSNTIKFLIGIAPQGAVTSKGWGGRVSNVHLTENCGLLDNLPHGDLILADRVFAIQDSTKLYCAEVKLPPLTREKNSYISLVHNITQGLALRCIAQSYCEHAAVPYTRYSTQCNARPYVIL